MTTILKPCLVPWAISPSMSGVTLTHVETDVVPECTVVFGAGRLGENGLMDSRRVEIVFDGCYYARAGYHPDLGGVEEALGYTLELPTCLIEGDHNLKMLQWRETGICPLSRFYVATQSAWLESLPEFLRRDSRHYVVDGRDGYVELIARSFKWREWIWKNFHREDAPKRGPVVGEGEGIA